MSNNKITKKGGGISLYNIIDHLKAKFSLFKITQGVIHCMTTF